MQILTHVLQGSPLHFQRRDLALLKIHEVILIRDRIFFFLHESDEEIKKGGLEDRFDSAGLKMNGEGERHKAKTRALF